MNTLERILNGEILIIENAFPEFLFRQIRSSCYKELKWDYVQDTALGNKYPESQKRKVKERDSNTEFANDFSFACIVNQQNSNSNESQKYIKTATQMQDGLLFVADQIDLSHHITSLFRIRVGMITNKYPQKIHTPHIDSTTHHIVALLYINTCDAPTRIYQERYEYNFKCENPSLAPTEFLSKMYDGYVSRKIDIDSVENRLVIFDGSYFHSSTSPTNIDVRIAINFNLALNNLNI